MRLDAAGILDSARFVESPNCDKRPEGIAVDLLVVHNISLPPGEFGGDGIVDFFTNRLDPGAHPYYAAIAGMRVSAHFLVRRGGQIVQFVRCAERAWHAGPSEWQGRTRCNDFSVGVELEGSDFVPFEPVQYVMLAELTRALCRAYPLRWAAGHSDIAPARKTDPGPFFDWRHYGELIGDLDVTLPEGGAEER